MSWSASCASWPSRSRTPPTCRSPTAGRTTARCCEPAASPARRRPGTTPPSRPTWGSSRPATPSSRADHGSCRCAGRPSSSSWHWSAGRSTRPARPGSRPSSRRCWCASRRWRKPASSPPTGPRCTRSTGPSCTSSAPARSPSPRCTAASVSTPTRCRSATWGPRPASGARPAPTGRTLAGRSASTSSTRSSCSPTPSRGAPTRSSTGSSRSRNRWSAASGSRTES